MMVYNSEYHHSVSDEQACEELIPSDFVSCENLDYDFSELKEFSAGLFKDLDFDKNKNVWLKKQGETSELKMSKINLTTNIDQIR